MDVETCDDVEYLWTEPPPMVWPLQHPVQQLQPMQLPQEDVVYIKTVPAPAPIEVEDAMDAAMDAVLAAVEEIPAGLPLAVEEIPAGLPLAPAGLPLAPAGLPLAPAGLPLAPAGLPLAEEIPAGLDNMGALEAYQIEALQVFQAAQGAPPGDEADEEALLQEAMQGLKRDRDEDEDDSPPRKYFVCDEEATVTAEDAAMLLRAPLIPLTAAEAQVPSMDIAYEGDIVPLENIVLANSVMDESQLLEATDPAQAPLAPGWTFEN